MDPTRPTTLRLAASTLAVAALVSAPGFAAADSKDEEATETIIVTADRVPKFNDTRVDEREGAQLISREYVRAQLATTLADALRKTTSVQVDEEAGNQGSIISIRGMQGDGVSVRIDGAPQNFNQVRHGGANTVWAEPDLYKTITVIPGAASNIYGNGSLGGVVKLETIDPDDLLGEETAAVTVRAGHETNGNAFVRSVEGAYQLTDSLSGLAYVLMRDNGAYEDGSGTETLGGATGSEDTNFLVKVSFTREAHTLEAARRSLAKEYTARGTQSRGRVVSATDQFTQVDDATTTLQYGFAPPENDWVNANIRYSILDVERDRRTADTEWSTWASKTGYLELENTSVLNRDGWAHRLRYGADFTNDDLVTAYFDADGDQIERTRDIAGIYLSDTFDIGERLSVVASLRRDDYRTQDRSTADETRNTALSKKLQVSYRPFADGTMEGLSLFALVGTGFRAPSVHETFGRGESGVNCSQGRRGFACSERIPNADLAAETNNSWEAGVRFAGEGVFDDGDQIRLSVGYIDNDVEDFIATQQLPPGETVINGRTYSVLRSTFTNINEADVSGWEYSLNYSGRRWFASLAAQTMDGRDTTTGLNLRDVSPHSRNASVGAYLFDGRARVGLDVTSRADKEIDEDPSFNRLAYTVFDIFASYRLGDRYKIQLRVENATDELYTKRFQSLSVDPQTGERQDLTYYQPGRNIKLSFEARLL